MKEKKETFKKPLNLSKWLSLHFYLSVQKNRYSVYFQIRMSSQEKSLSLYFLTRHKILESTKKMES